MPPGTGTTRDVRPSQRFLLAGLTVAAAELSLSLVLEGTWRYFLALAAATVLLAVVAHRRLEPPRGDDGRGGGGSDPTDPDPPWWPEFERQFHDHVLTGPSERA